MMTQSGEVATSVGSSGKPPIVTPQIKRFPIDLKCSVVT